MVAVIVCFAYWALLTVLLLAPDPAAMIGIRRMPHVPLGDVGMHFAAFALLSLSLHFVRWPKRPVLWLPAVLLLYGLATESLQYFVPPRAVELHDYVDNILGVLLGAAIYWAVQRRFAHRLPSPMAVELVREQVAGTLAK
jgi:VanZ family protein